ncbi:glycosyltransferase [Maridesulfovibrio sp.]|uniref:CgeB family protein n=1 Tax=Maridesulfovibrio sp. TaxID=2795000 RepID=UPI002A18B39C|nr:glycosyltransferase [Maridesulfovibrio sp.]
MDGDVVADLRVIVDGRKWHLWGRAGAERELSLAGLADKGRLPVLIGAGLGICLQSLAERGPVAVLDIDPDMAGVSGADRFRDHPQVCWIDGTPVEALEKVRQWRTENGGGPLEIIRIPLYLRLDRDWYAALAATLESEKDTSSADFWSEVDYPKFRNAQPRILFFNRPYFLNNEIRSAMERLGLSYCSIDIGTGDTVREGFVEDLLKAVVDFKPDFALTVNHFGVDRQGRLTDLLLKLKLPLASWFVDNPHLILYRYSDVSPELTSIFTYDAGNLDIMREKGFRNVFYLPLATDPHRFVPGLKGRKEWRSEVSFVGNSMVDAVRKTLHESGISGELKKKYPGVAAEFGTAEELSVEKFLAGAYPEILKAMERFKSDEQRLSFEALLTWEATRQYRLSCLKGTIGFNPLVVGDAGWKNLLGVSGWRYLPSLDYYDDLPAFYPMSKVSFNCTSRQMKGAVNQRIFDVPACGGFVLTDYREQMENLFEPGSEIIAYRNVDEIPQLLEKWLADAEGRSRISAAARRRIFAFHTYEHRMQDIISKMRITF